MTETLAAPVTPALERESIVFTENLTKQFGSHTAVGELNIEVERGSITGIVGPNGAGKTTTFLMLATLLEPTSGTSYVCGHDPVVEPREVRSKIGYMPDFFGIYDDLRVHEYLDFFAHTYGVEASKRLRLTEDLLELVDLTVKRDAFVDTLSRGMKQRLGLARALVHDPELLILDEPASGLDPRARVELRALLLELQRMGKTIVISSHILSELEEVCSHVVILEAGRLIAQGTSSEIATGLAVARRVRIRAVADDMTKLREALDGRAGVSEVREEDGGVEAELIGGDEEAAALLAALIAEGVRVVGFSNIETGLEEIFMQVTKGVVQ
jgi:ABC-2 type transport system ATP-binding protein